MSSEGIKDQEPLSYQSLLDRYKTLSDQNQILQAENQDLRVRLKEAEELERAIRERDLDALIIPGPEGDMIFTLNSADHAYRVLVETMNEGTVTVACDGTILYCNRQFAELIKTSAQDIVGTSIYQLIAPENLAIFKAFLKHDMSGEIKLQAEEGVFVPVYLSVSSLKAEGSPNSWFLVFTDLNEQKKNEEIVASERLSRSIIEQAAEAIAVCDISGRIIRFSNAMLKLCRCNLIFQRFEDIINLRFSEGPDAGNTILPVSSALRGSSIFGVEVTSELKGSKSHLLLNSGPLKNAIGEIIGCVVTLTDITELKQAVEALRESEERLRLLGDNLPDSAVYQYTHEPDGSARFLYVSAGIEQLNGVRVSDVLRDPGTLHRQIPPEYFNRFVEAEACSAHAQSDFDMEIPMIRPDGQISWMHLHSRPRRLPDGRTIWDGVQVDITGRKQIEEALQKSEELYHMLFDHSMDAIVLTDPRDDGKILSANPAACQMLGWAEEELIGKGRDVLFDLEDPALSTLLNERTCSGSAKAQLAYRRKDGTKFPGEISTALFTDSNGEPRTVAIIRDITKRKQIEEALRKSEERYRTLFTNMTEGFVLAEVVYDKDGKPHDYRYLEINPAFELQSGIKKERMLGKSVLEMIHNADTIQLQKLGEVALSGQSTHLEFFSQAVNKHFDIYIFSPEKGKVAAIFRDITERKKAEAKLKETLDNLEYLVQERTAELGKTYNSLKESERGLAEAQRMAHLGNWDWNILTDEIRGSDEAYRIFGFNPQEPEITYNTFLNCIHPEDLDYVVIAFKEALKGNLFDIEYRIISVSGDERILHMQNDIIFSEDNIPIRMRGTAQDITERKKTEEALFKSQKQYKTLFNSISEGFAHYKAIYDENGRLYDLLVIEINPAGAKISGVEREIQLGRTWGEVWPDIEDYVYKIYQNVDQTGKAVQFEHFSNITGRWYVTQIDRIEKGQFAIIFRDINDNKIAEEVLARAEEARIKEIHHRIKNNLQVISSLLDLEAEKFSDKKVIDAFKESQNRVVSMALIHEELYKGKESDNLDFAEYLRKLTAYLLNLHNLEDSGIKLRLEFEEVYLDMDTAIPLGIIVNELVSNSLKHAFPNGKQKEISIILQKMENFTTEKEKSELENESYNYKENNYCYVLRVADNGKGIAEEINFQNADTLGLQLVNILVDQIDGYVELKRNPGTEFSIWFNNMEK